VNYDAVLEGGGVKLMGHIGAIAAIEQQGFTPSNLAGTSAGAIVAAFRTAGYTTTQMRKLVSDMDFNTFKDGAFFGTKFYHLWRHMGIYKGDVFYQFMKEKLKDQGIERFGDLRTTDDDPRWRYKLKVIASDLTRGRLVILPDDCKSYGIEPDMLELAYCILLVFLHLSSIGHLIKKSSISWVFKDLCPPLSISSTVAPYHSLLI